MIRQTAIAIGMWQLNGWEAPLLQILFCIFDQQRKI